MYEYPPLLTGSDSSDLRALRDYLVRMARSLEAVTAASAAPAVTSASAPARQGAADHQAREEAAKALRRSARELRSLILKTADDVERRTGMSIRALGESQGEELNALRQSLGGLEASLSEFYLARSDFGDYLEQADSQLRLTAREIVESYQFDSLLKTYDSLSRETLRAVESIRGEIRRGLITDPSTGETALGIAIAQSLQFTGQVREEGGLSYYELSPGQTLGLYTSTGWQFWVAGRKRGWFDSSDGRLHVVSQTVEESLQISDWLVTTSGGLGLRLLG